MPEKHSFIIAITVTKYHNYILSKFVKKFNVQEITVEHVYVVTCLIYD
jgi:hypothetical protein